MSYEASGDAVYAGGKNGDGGFSTTVNIGDDKTSSVTINAGGGIYALANGHINVTADKVDLTGTATSAYAPIWAQNNTTNVDNIPVDNRAGITINAKDTFITSAGSGMVASFTYGDGSHRRGSSEMEGVALAAYGVWMADNGMFADVIARLGTFDTDMKVDDVEGTIESVVSSISGEFGWRFDLYERFYLEPQVELAYTCVNGDNFKLGSARYDVDHTDSLIGRAGVSAGWKLPGDRGDIYARASVVQQFLGDSRISGRNHGACNVYEIDGEDTWFEYGVGSSIRLSDSLAMWADIERTEGATIDEEWRGTVGLRYSF